METRTTILNFQPGTSIPVVHVSQYDVGVLLRFILYDGSEMAEIGGGSGTSVVIAATRPSGTGFSVPCSIIASNIVEVATTEAMTKEFGIMDAEIRYTNDGDSVGTGNFKFLVEAASHADYIIDEDHAEWVRIAQEVASDRASAQSAKQSAQQSATRAETAANRVAGEVDKAIAAAATATSAKDAAVTAKSAAETAAENAEASAINAGDAVDAAQLAADDAEAYAVGTRGGEPVTSTDPTYHNNSKYYAEQGGAGNLASEFSTSTAYAVGDYVRYNAKIWEFTTAHAAGAWNASHVTEVKVMDEISNLKGDLSTYLQNTNHLTNIDLNECLDPGSYDLQSIGRTYQNFPLQEPMASVLTVSKDYTNGLICQRVIVPGLGSVFFRWRYSNETWSGWTSAGLTQSIKEAINNCFESVTWSTENSGELLKILKNNFGIDVSNELTLSISDGSLKSAFGRPEIGTNQRELIINDTISTGAIVGASPKASYTSVLSKCGLHGISISNYDFDKLIVEYTFSSSNGNAVMKIAPLFCHETEYGKFYVDAMAPSYYSSGEVIDISGYKDYDYLFLKVHCGNMVPKVDITSLSLRLYKA